jgi:uncharacterized protein
MALATRLNSIQSPAFIRRLCWGMLLIGITLGLLSTQATAASFDCKKAASWVEKTVCSNPELSKLDEEMAKAYHDALASLSPEGQKETKEYQRKWLNDISPSCKVRAKFEFDDSKAKCLKDGYGKRIEQLQQTLIKFPDRIFRNVHIDDTKVDKTCENNMYVPIKLTYPQIENPRDANEKVWDDLIAQKAIDKYKKYKSEVCSDFYSGYHVMFSSKHLISCENSDYVYEHGAPDGGYMNGFCLNWLLEARRELLLEDLFDNNTDWRNKLTALITQQKKEQEATDTCQCKYIAPGENLKSGLIDINKITPNDWLITKEKDGLSFLLYPWNMRRYVLVTIDWKTLDPYLSKNGRSLIYD